MVNPNLSLLIQIANFLVLIWLLNTVLYKPIRGVLRERKGKISGLEREIETSRKEATERQTALKEGINQAKAAGLKEREAIERQALEQEKQIIMQINEKAQADLAQMRERVSAEMQAARTALEQEMAAFAGAIGQKVLGRLVS